MLLDYEILRVIWWLLLGILLIGFAIMDGFDLGVATLLPFIAKNETEKQIVINTIEPYWEGNQVWLLLGGGAIFAAWPAVYAVSFSSLYLALLLLLVALILRPVAFGFRSKVENPNWKKVWDFAHFISGILPAILCGVAVGNAMLGLPFIINPEDMSIVYKGSFFALLNPFALLCGLVSFFMLLMQGGTYVALKTEDPISQRGINIAKYSALILLFLYVIGGLMVATMVNGYIITSDIIINGPSVPTLKEVILQKGAWFNNFFDMPWTLLAPTLVLIGIFANLLFLKSKCLGAAFVASSTAIFGVVATAGVCMFPFILPSSLDLKSSLTVWDASSSALTLQIMLIVALIFVPIVLFYTAWVFRVLKGKVTEKTIVDNEY
jgi:cytochrome d ubiquinol oxidase subunit II